MIFYMRFIHGFSKITNSFSNLVQKYIPFDFGEKCRDAFDTL